MREKEKLKRLAGINEDRLSQIQVVNKFDCLKRGLRYLIANNEANNAPYHNLNHALTIVKYASEGAESEGLSERETINLLLAAMFHDFNHSEGKSKDDVNIKNAKKGLREFVESEVIDGVDLEEMEKIIDATEYPYQIKSGDLTLSQKILRDADLMQIFEDNWIHQNILGIALELGMEFEKFLVAQRKFIEGAEFNSNWGKKMRDKNWSRVIEEFETLEKIISEK